MLTLEVEAIAQGTYRDVYYKAKNTFQLSRYCLLACRASQSLPRRDKGARRISVIACIFSSPRTNTHAQFRTGEHSGIRSHGNRKTDRR